LRVFGLSTQLSRRISSFGGKRTSKEQGTKMFRLQGRLKHIKKKLKQWNQEVFGNIDQAKKISKKKWVGFRNYVSKKATMRRGKKRRAICIRIGRKYVSKRKYFGAKNLECSG
jgi:hypothetical protein